jgi:hypothetical protein
VTPNEPLIKIRVIGRNPVNGIIMRSIERVRHVHSFAPFAITVTERIPDILRIGDRIILGIGRMILANKE